jgi:hypothetical protein
MLKDAKSIIGIVFLSSGLAVGLGFAQNAPAPGNQPAQQAPLLSPNQLDDLVAPIALYPDPLLGQVLAASTYPLEIGEAQQWIQQNSQLQGQQLMDAARQQNWDASVQALVAFPEVLRLLSGNLRWTTDLGNAFLAQQADVMAAVQRMRSRAQANGKLRTTPQQTVTTDDQGGQSAIQIQPANPDIMYVPNYDPEYVWGPPLAGWYPDLYYPDLYGFGFGFYPGIYVAGFFPGWFGWGVWGWGCGWFGHSLFVNGGFFHRYGFRGGWGGFGGRGLWAHDPGHRLGVPYPSHALASRFGGNRAGSNAFAGSRAGNGASTGRGWRSFSGNGRSGMSYSAPSQGYRGSPYASRSYSPGYSRGYSSPNSYGYSAPRAYSAPHSYAAPRVYSAPRSYSMPRSYGGFSGARSFGGFSGGRSFGGFSGGHSGGFSGGHGGFSGGHGGGGRR